MPYGLSQIDLYSLPPLICLLYYILFQRCKKPEQYRPTATGKKINGRYLRHHHNVVSRKVELLDRFAKDDFGETVGVHLEPP
jgi:hypothetical protein